MEVEGFSTFAYWWNWIIGLFQGGLVTDMHMRGRKETEVKKNLLHCQEWHNRDRSYADMCEQMLKTAVLSTLATIAYMTL
jgi:hypothetical protein